MTVAFSANLVNGPWGDPTLYVEMRHERRAMLFDLGEIHALAPRKLLRIEHVFVSHTHLDHFVGFDHLLRVVLDRDRRIAIYGPDGMIEAVRSKLAGYVWNLAARYRNGLAINVVEVSSRRTGQTASFRLANHFRAEGQRAVRFDNGVIHTASDVRVEAEILDHGIPCLGFALSEVAHANIWRNRVEALGLPMGQWLNALKKAALADLPDDTAIEVYGKDYPRRTVPLGQLRGDVVHITSGRKIAYVTDVAFTPDNRRRIRDLAKAADILFIEAAFARRDTDLAADRNHLTTEQAGSIAHEAGALRVEPLHFSSRYEGQEEALRREVEEAFGAVPEVERS
ncbi:MAG: ribonuclease Z [Alphaproteobacteria bacterium]